MIAKNFVSSHSTVFVRFYAEVQGFDSHFRIVATNLRKLRKDDVCAKKTERSCGDDFCVAEELSCNGRKNCPYNEADEKGCRKQEEDLALDLAAPHIAIVLVLLLITFLATVVGSVYHINKLIAQDREKLLASKASLNNEGIGALVAGERPLLPGDPGLEEEPSNGAENKAKISTASEVNPGCYVPDGGFPLPARAVTLQL